MAMITSMDIEEGTDWKISIPTKALHSNSVLIEQKGDNNFSELYTMMNKVAQFWEQKGIFNYLIYSSSEEHSWEMAPVQGFFQQLKVMARVTFGRAEIEKKYTDYKDFTSFAARATSETVQQVATDAFCKKEVIDSQLLWEGKHIRVLYNYAPIGKEGLHFLLVPKVHKERFSELSQEEFIEIQTFAESLMKRFPDHLCYRYNKTGSLAGQTVPHFHEHIVFILPEHDFLGKLSVFLRMIIPPRPLDSIELSGRVAHYKLRNSL
jgi:diadenosine tetraphosphate (Ap4A) HIT family hydrolase